MLYVLYPLFKGHLYINLQNAISYYLIIDI